MVTAFTTPLGYQGTTS